jgi:hypothetical protein
MEVGKVTIADNYYGKLRWTVKQQITGIFIFPVAVS